jgi:archaellum component FlaC
MLKQFGKNTEKKDKNLNMTDNDDNETTTQPMLKSILEEMRGGFATLREEIQEFRRETLERLDRIETRLTAVEKEVELINRRLMNFGDQLNRTSARVDLLEGRIENVERRPE